MPFKTLDERFDPALELPAKIGGVVRTYRIQPVNIDTGVEVTAMMGIAARAHLSKSDPTPDEIADIIASNEGQESLYKRVLGDVYDQLRDHGADFEVVKLFGTTATIWITSGLEPAEEFWNNGGQLPKAPKKPTDRKPSAKRTKRA